MTIDERLQDSARRAREKAGLAKKLETTGAMVSRCQKDLDRAQKSLTSEEKDVLKLEGKTLVSLWHGIMGTTDKAKRKEQEEYLEAKLKFDEAKAALENLEADMERIKRELATLGNPEDEYRIALQDKEDYLLQAGGEAAARLLEIAGEAGLSQAREKELVEAIGAGKKAEQALAKAENSLGNASGWGVVDIIGGGLLSTAMKHSNINDAQTAIRKAQDLLRRFQQELSDVHQEMKVDIGTFLNLADYFLDGLIVDIFVQSKVNSALDRTRLLRRRVGELLEELQLMRTQNQATSEQLAIEKTRLLEAGNHL